MFIKLWDTSDESTSEDVLNILCFDAKHLKSFLNRIRSTRDLERHQRFGDRDEDVVDGFPRKKITKTNGLQCMLCSRDLLAVIQNQILQTVTEDLILKHTDCTVCCHPMNAELGVEAG